MVCHVQAEHLRPAAPVVNGLQNKHRLDRCVGADAREEHSQLGIAAHAMPQAMITCKAVQGSTTCMQNDSLW